MKNKFFLFNCITIGFFALFVLGNLFLSNGEYSALENRYLQGRPELSLQKIADRSYMDDAESYYNDQLMFRDTFIRVKAGAERLLGKTENNGVYFAKDHYVIEKPADYNETLILKNLQSVKNMAAEETFDVSFCMIPQAYEVLMTKLPSGTYEETVYQLREQIQQELEGTNAKNADPAPTLFKKSDEYIFYRSDHHQTSEGSYLVYQQLGAALGYEPLDIGEFEQEVVSEEFLGTTYSKGLLPMEPDTITVYKSDLNTKATLEFYGENKTSDTIFFPEHLEEKDKYSYFLDGNHALTIVNGGAGNGKKIALFRDSYANSLVPFLIHHFDSVHLIDMRYFMEDPIEYLLQNDIRQILFLYGSSTFMSDETIGKIGEYGDDLAEKIEEYRKSLIQDHFGLVEETEPVTDDYFADAVFIGDSLTVGFEAYSGLVDATFLAKSSMKASGLYSPGSDGKSILEKAKEAAPKKIYVMLGINEYLVAANHDTVIEKYVKLMDDLRADHPDAIIYFQSVLPMSERMNRTSKPNNAEIYSYNEKLCKLAEEKGMYFVDVYRAVTDSNGSLLAELTGDGVHLGSKGCQLWADYLRNHAIGGVMKKAGEPASAQVQQQPQEENPLRPAAERLEETVTFEGDIGETKPKALLQTHGIPADWVENAYGVVGGGAAAEEIALFELKDSANAPEVLELLEGYIQTRIKSFENYIPKEVPKLESAVLYSSDNFVALVIAADLGETEKVLKTIW